MGACKETAEHVSALRDTKRELRSCLRKDKLLWIQQLAKQAGDLSVKCVVQRLRPLLGPPKRRAVVGSGLPAVARLDGSLAQDPDEVRERWIEHFAINEGGHRCSTREVERQCQHRQQRQRLDLPGISSQELPSKLQLESALRCSATGKAIGPDGIPAEVLHFGAGCLATPIYQILLKTVLRLEEPLAFKGGIVHRIWKGKIAPDLCHSHRAILVSSTVGKAVHRTLRGPGIVPFLSSHSPLQIGGLPRYPVTMAAQAARLFASPHQKGNGLLLFLDLREAFYRVARPLLVHMGHTEEDTARVFQALQLPAEAFHTFRCNLAGTSAACHAGASEWMQSLFRELLSDTWFRLPQQPDVIVTDLGTRPGDCLADLLFSYLFAVVLDKVKHSLMAEGFDLQLEWKRNMRGSVVPVHEDGPTDHVPLMDCTWMDDMCLMIATKTASEVFPCLRFAAGTLIDICLGHGMTPNLDKGKTEAVVLVHGAGSRSVRKQFLSAREPTVACQSVLWGHARIRVTPAYKHLGGWLTHRATCDKELRSRVGLAWSAFNKHKKQVFASPIVPVADKVAIFGSVVLSVMLYGAGTWTNMHSKSLQVLENAYVAMARCMLAKHLDPDSPRVSGSRVLATLQLPSMALHLHVSRLSYLASFVSLDVQCLWALAHAEGLWLGTVADSLQWLWTEVDAGRHHATWQAAWEVWREAIPGRPRWWKRLLRFARESACRRECIQDAWQHYRGLLLRRLISNGAALPDLPEEQRMQGEVCVPCGRCFMNKQAWAVHAFKVHGRVRRERSLVDGLACPICLRTFASNIRLCRHVQHSAPCKEQLIRRGFHAPVGPGMGSRHARNEAELMAPAMQGLGPLPAAAPAPGDRDAPLHAECCHETLRELVGIARIERHDWGLKELLDAVRDIMGKRCLSAECLKDTAAAWRVSCADNHDETLSVRWSALVRVSTDWVCDNLSVPWLCGFQVADQSQSVHTFAHSEAALSWLDFSLVEAKGFQTPCDDGGFLLCHSSWQPAFRDLKRNWTASCDLATALKSAEWLRAGQALIEQGYRGLFCLSLLGCHWQSCGPATPIKAKAAGKALALVNLFSDVVGLGLQLWERQSPFVMVLPAMPEAFLRNILELPGIDGFRSEEWQVIFNISEEGVPEFLFHCI